MPDGPGADLLFVSLSASVISAASMGVQRRVVRGAGSSAAAEVMSMALCFGGKNLSLRSSAFVLVSLCAVPLVSFKGGRTCDRLPFRTRAMFHMFSVFDVSKSCWWAQARFASRTVLRKAFDAALRSGPGRVDLRECRLAVQSSFHHATPLGDLNLILSKWRWHVVWIASWN